jgi:hypothetical protein
MIAKLLGEELIATLAHAQMLRVLMVAKSTNALASASTVISPGQATFVQNAISKTRIA